MVLLYSCISLQTSLEIARYRDVCRKALLNCRLFKLVARQRMARWASMWMRICQSCRWRVHNNSQAVTVNSCSLMSFVKIPRSMSHLCGFRSIFAETLLTTKLFWSFGTIFVIFTFILFILPRQIFPFLPLRDWISLHISESELSLPFLNKTIAN